MSSNNPFGDQQFNPYAVDNSGLGYAQVGYSNDSERIRQELIAHEASIKSIGLLYLIGAVFGTLAGLILTVGIALQPRNVAPTDIFVGLFVLALSIGQGFVAVGLRRLRSWTRIPVGILSGIGLLAIPLGTIVNGYILYLIFSEKGGRVFAPEYQEIIRQTPHIKYQTSIIIKIFLVLLLAVIGLGVLAAIFSG